VDSACVDPDAARVEQSGAVYVAHAQRYSLSRGGSAGVSCAEPAAPALARLGRAAPGSPSDGGRAGDDGEPELCGSAADAGGDLAFLGAGTLLVCQRPALSGAGTGSRPADIWPYNRPAAAV